MLLFETKIDSAVILELTLMHSRTIECIARNNSPPTEV